jgi:hypothetical protein
MKKEAARPKSSKEKQGKERAELAAGPRKNASREPETPKEAS